MSILGFFLQSLKSLISFEQEFKKKNTLKFIKVHWSEYTEHDKLFDLYVFFHINLPFSVFNLKHKP